MFISQLISHITIMPFCTLQNIDIPNHRCYWLQACHHRLQGNPEILTNACSRLAVAITGVGILRNVKRRLPGTEIVRCRDHTRSSATEIAQDLPSVLPSARMHTASMAAAIRSAGILWNAKRRLPLASIAHRLIYIVVSLSYFRPQPHSTIIA